MYSAFECANILGVEPAERNNQPGAFRILGIWGLIDIFVRKHDTTMKIPADYETHPFGLRMFTNRWEGVANAHSLLC